MDKKQIISVLDGIINDFEKLTENADDIQILRFKYIIYRYEFNQLMSQYGIKIETDNELMERMNRYQQIFIKADDILFTNGY